ncbi:unnamed protein product [Tuber melanosporum]|uniref:(Perigord truffle) hypothetical protein n=1 Tax=Tuber melanosporum (strain Mel28) TaxID=656061 RepID=D5GJW4_TUBMM|nr:uncharacterized protein GSTUM_00009237001 [Tuber melanosporum]CAZ84807.1 unnamed protein product [Tuber melanosporum]
MRLYKRHFGPLWIATLVLSSSVLEVGGQTLGCLAEGGCFRGCFPKCPGLETDCVCSGFRTVLDMMGILGCALRICPPSDAMGSFSALGVGCLPFISTTTRRSRASSSTTPTPLTACGPVISASASARPTTSASVLPSSSSSSRSFSTRSSPLISSDPPSSRCTTMNSTSPASPIPTSPTMTSQIVSPAPTPPLDRPPNEGTSSPPFRSQQERKLQLSRGLIVALVLGPLGFLTSLLAIFLILRRRRGRGRRSISSFTGISDFDANRGSITAPLPTFSSDPPRVPLADVGTRPTTRGSQMSAGVGAGAMAAVAVARRASTRREDIVSATPVSSSQGNSQLHIFPQTSRRLPAGQRQPQSQQNPDLLLRSLRKPLPQLPRPPEEARIGPRAGPSTRNSPLALPSTVYPIPDNPRPMSAISELAEVDQYQPIPDDATEVEFRRVYHDVRRALNRSPSTSTDQNSTDWSIMTDLSRNSTTRSFRPER